jgi:hypothetical protein
MSVGITANPSNTNMHLGGGDIHLVNDTVTATLVNVAGLPAIKIEWDNSYRESGQLLTGPAWDFWLVRYDGNNTSDTVYYSRGTIDSAFIDTAIAIGSTYHYNLIRHDFFTTLNWYSGLSDTVVVQSVNVLELELQEERHRIYPNPSNTNYVVLYYDTEQGQNDHLLIYSATGMLVSRQKLTDGSSHRINISNLKRGTYLYQIRGTMGKIKPISGKLVVQ